MREQGTGYWGQIIEGVERAADEIKYMGVETEIFEFDSYDPSAFDRVSDAVYGCKPEGLLFAPVMQEYTRSFVDADMPETTPLCVIGQDSFRGGCLAGRLP